MKPLEKIGRIEAELNLAFFERNDEIRSLLVALLAREHVLLLGPPGTAKSALTQALCEAIDGGDYFQWLLTKFTTPEEIFGPISLKGLENDEVKRITSSKLPEAHIAFLDEIFKANSAILNSLLTLINERQYDNGPVRQSVPLISVVGASNELPDDSDGLGALFDRFLIRHWVGYLADRDALKSLLLSDTEPSISTTISLAELARLQVMVGKVKFSEDSAEAVLQIKSDLEAIGVRVSDRRWRKTARIVRANALLNRHKEVEDDDLLILEHLLWKEPDERAQIREIVGKVASPLTAEALSILDAAKEQHSALLQSEGSADFLVAAVEARAALKEMRERLASQAPNPKGKVAATLDDLERMQADIKARMDRALG